MQWTPESEIALVEAVLLGETVELATAYKFKTQLDDCVSIAAAAALVHDACQCALMQSMELARRRLQELAATSSEFTALASAAWQLCLVVRYGDVRRFDAEPLMPLVQELFVQGALALFHSANCDDSSVKPMMQAIDELNRVALEFHDRIEEPLWIAQLQKLADADDRNPLLSGYACAILLERGVIENEALAARSRDVFRRECLPTWAPAGSKDWLSATATPCWRGSLCGNSWPNILLRWMKSSFGEHWCFCAAPLELSVRTRNATLPRTWANTGA